MLCCLAINKVQQLLGFQVLGCNLKSSHNYISDETK